jgi:hypothetical protein
MTTELALIFKGTEEEPGSSKASVALIAYLEHF